MSRPTHRPFPARPRALSSARFLANLPRLAAFVPLAALAVACGADAPADVDDEPEAASSTDALRGRGSFTKIVNGKPTGVQLEVDDLRVFVEPTFFTRESHGRLHVNGRSCPVFLSQEERLLEGGRVLDLLRVTPADSPGSSALPTDLQVWYRREKLIKFTTVDAGPKTVLGASLVGDWGTGRTCGDVGGTACYEGPTCARGRKIAETWDCGACCR